MFANHCALKSASPVRVWLITRAIVNLHLRQISLAVQALLSQLCKAFPSDGHVFKLCAMIW
jgi:hypothetical protein